MCRGKRRTGLAAFDKRGKFRFVSRSKTIDEFRQRPAVITRRKRPPGQRLGAIAPAIRLDDDFMRLLLEAANLNLPLFSKNPRFDSIAGDMIAADLHLRHKILAEPHVEKRIIEIFFARRVGMTIDA